MKKVLTVFALFVFSISFGTNGQEGMTAKVVKVIDGNTIEVITSDKEVVQVMFKDIDSPEMGQQFGKEAQQFTEKLLLKKKVFVVMKGKDRWGNRLAGITLNNGKCAEEEILEAGYAWHNTLKSKDAKLSDIESKTKEMKKGLWADEEPTAPWMYRRKQSMRVARSQ